MQGISGTQMKGAAALQGAEPSQAPEPLQSAGGSGGLLTKEKDLKEGATEAKFGDLWKQIQTQYGAKPDKGREIKKVLGKDDFLRIMITQMKNQDPSSPFKAEEMATQMAQFASVEQLQNLNTSMGKMVNANQPLERLAMTGLIGKTITIDRERFVHNENSTSSLSYVLDKPTKQTKLKIISEQGETILEKDLGPQKAGEQTFVWDGGKTNGLATKGGNYIFRIDAEDVSGRALPMQTKGQAKVVGVAFDGPEGVLLVGNPNSPQKITMRNIIRIDTSGEGPAIPGARTMASALQGQGVTDANMTAGAPTPQGQVEPVVAKQKPNGHFVEYQKPEGPKSPDGMGADARRAAAAYEAAKVAPGNNLATENSEKSLEKGFPSGLSSGDND